jgi:acetyl-CoA acetyltransferase
MDDACAIAGIGATEFSKNSGRSELRLAVEAALAALDDAGIERSEVDGLVSFAMENNEHSAVARNLGLDAVTFFAQTPYGGGGGCGTVGLAAQAIMAGAANVVLCFRAMNERSQQRFGQPRTGGKPLGLATSAELDASWSRPYGVISPAGGMALIARRYMHTYGATSEDFGRVSMLSRDFASTNPAAWFYKRPITLADHQQSKMIADPLRLLDCCQETDGAVAIVVTRADRARDLKATPVRIAAAAQGFGDNVVGMATPYSSRMEEATETEIVGRQLRERSGLSPADMDVAILYDHFSFAVLMQLEALNFCDRGEAAAYVASGMTGRGGAMPMNTHGGQIGEGYVHGFNGIAEAVRQIRGTAVNQVESAQVALVTSGSHVPTSGLVLTKW